MSTRTLNEKRQFMIRHHLKDRGISDERILSAFKTVPREEFTLESTRDSAYEDFPLPIGYGQTISQPYIVAFMVEKLDPKPENSVLEIGTGCGYQTAILSLLAKKVYSIEIIGVLVDTARRRLENLNYTNIEIIHGDGHSGWKEKKPFDKIIVSAAAHIIPVELTDQLAPGGRMVIPVGKTVWGQTLRIIEKDAEGKLSEKRSLGVRFVPLVKGELI